MEAQEILLKKLEDRIKSLENKESSKEGLNKIKAETERILKQSKYHKYEITTDRKEMDALFLQSQASFNESKAISNLYNVIPLVHKIYILKEVLNPTQSGMESLITKPTLSIEGYREEAETKLMELIKKL